MSISLGVVMDPIAKIKTYKDSSFAMLLAAQARGWRLYYMEQADLFQRDGESYATMRRLRVDDNAEQWFEWLGEAEVLPLTALDTILMRKDPPFDMEFVYSTYLLEQAEENGVLVVNRSASLRDVNEKLYATRFPQCTVPVLVTRQRQLLLDFLAEQQDIILKPLDGMGGASIFRLQQGDPNTSVIIETIGNHGQTMVMAQRFIPEITAGDKRILLVDGQPVPYALARIPAKGETRGNLAAGGRGVGVALTERDYWICEQIAPTLRDKGLLFVGIDVIGDYLTEINVTSPTCIRELDDIYGLDIAGQLMDAIEVKLKQ